MASLKQRVEALEQAAPTEGERMPSEIWLVGIDPVTREEVTPVLLWRRAGAQPEGAPHHGDA